MTPPGSARSRSKAALKILHVEDNPLDAELLVETLRSGGIECETFRVDTEASFVSALETGTFDLILSDFSLPSFSGTKALELARARHPEIPFIVVSGTIGEDAAIDSLIGGATDYVLKHKFSRLMPAVLRARHEAEERSRRLETERALRESERKYRALFEESKDSIVILTPDGGFSDINSAGVALLGYASRDEVLGPRPGPGVHVDPERVGERWNLLEAQGYVRDLELQLRRKDGAVRTVLETGTPERDDRGEILAYRGIWRDVTEQRSVEAQLMRAQRLEIIGMLASGIAHDLNNVFAPIMMSAELLLSQADQTHPERPTLEALDESARRGSDLVKQILTFARGGDDQRRAVRIEYLIRDVEKVFTATFPKSIRMRSDVESGLWSVHGSDTQIHQVLMNLGVNARDAMSSGGLLTIAARNVLLSAGMENQGVTCGPGPAVRIEVSDTGAGIPEDIRSHIFNPFFTTKGAGHGTGLGLSTVRTIVGSHGGVIEVASAVGCGTSFTVHLPAAGSESGPVPEIEPVREGQGELVLVVDYETSIREMMQAALEAHGYRVLTATDASGGARIFLQYGSEIQVILCDLDGRSPAVAGLLDTVRDMNVSAAGFVWMTSRHHGNVDPVPFAGARRPTVLRKPFTTKALLDAVYGMTRMT